MKKEELMQKLEDLRKENIAREAKVDEWAKQREILAANIQKAKEDHDFTRGQIVMLEGILSTGEQEPKSNEHKS